MFKSPFLAGNAFLSLDNKTHEKFYEICKSMNVDPGYPREKISPCFWVMDKDFGQEFDRLALEVADRCKSYLNDYDQKTWGAQKDDMVCVDFAVTEKNGSVFFELVEIQSFATVLSSVLSLAESQEEILPFAHVSGGEIPRHILDKSAGLSCLEKIYNPENQACVVLENSPKTQGNLSDLETLSYLTKSPIACWRDIFRQKNDLFYQNKKIERIINRVVFEELSPDELKTFKETFAGANVSWHNHPAKYYALNKKVLRDFHYKKPSEWKDLGCEVKDLVAKNTTGCGGRSVLFDLSEDMLGTLKDDEWVVGKRFTPMSVTSTEYPVFMEMRAVVIPDKHPWIAARMGRAYSGQVAALKHLKGNREEGLCCVWVSR